MINHMSEGRSDAPRRAAMMVDLLLVIIALAVGCGAVRLWLALRNEAEPLRHTPYPPYPVTPRDWYLAARLVLLPATLVVVPLWLGLGKPRRHRSRPEVSPGVVVPFALLVAGAFGVLGEHRFRVLFFAGYPIPGPKANRLLCLMNAGTDDLAIASGIAVAWVTLGLAGCWRSEATWAGRLGRLLGLAWILGCLGFRLYMLGNWVVSGRDV